MRGLHMGNSQLLTPDRWTQGGFIVITPSRTETFFHAEMLDTAVELVSSHNPFRGVSSGKLALWAPTVFLPAVCCDYYWGMDNEPSDR